MNSYICSYCSLLNLPYFVLLHLLNGYLIYLGDRGQKIIPWEGAQGPQFSCVYACYKSAFNPLTFKNRASYI
jgi:hypothetical protein